MKKDEHYPLVAIVRQEGLTGRTAAVKFSVRTGGEVRRLGRLDPARTAQRGPERADADRGGLLRAQEDRAASCSASRSSGLRRRSLPENNRAESEATVHDDSAAPALRRVRPDLGVAFHQGGVPPRQAGRHAAASARSSTRPIPRCRRPTSCSCPRSTGRGASSSPTT